MFGCVLVASLVFYDFMFVLHKQTSSLLLRIYWTPATTDFGFKQTKTEPQSPRLHMDNFSLCDLYGDRLGPSLMFSNNVIDACSHFCKKISFVGQG